MLPDDTEATLAARVLAVEHRIYPLALRLVAEGRARRNAVRRRAMSVVDASRPSRTRLCWPKLADENTTGGSRWQVLQVNRNGSSQRSGRSTTARAIFRGLSSGCTAGGILLVHGLTKLQRRSIAGFASASLARRGIEPSIPLAYVVFFLETVGAVCIILGPVHARVRGRDRHPVPDHHVPRALARRVSAGTGRRGGWEYPLFWGLHLAGDRHCAAAGPTRSTASSGANSERQRG